MIHFFEYKEFDPKENYGQVYIKLENLYKALVDNKTGIYPNGGLQSKQWGQKNLPY
jgi:hypothetical protein